MYAKHSKIIYGSFGVCTITDIRKETFFDEEKTYYILKPQEADNSVYYVPTDSPALTDKMKRILSKDEIEALLRDFTFQDVWVKDPQLRSKRFKEILTSNDRSDLMHLVLSVYYHKQEYMAAGKKPMVSDTSSMAKGEKLLYEEFSLVMDIKPDDVISFLLEKTGCDQKDVAVKQPD